jgi:hypothetical protein
VQKLSLASLEESAFGSIVPSTGIFFFHYANRKIPARMRTSSVVLVGSGVLD